MDNIIPINKIVRNRLYGNKRKEKNYKQDEAYRFRKMGIKGITEYFTFILNSVSILTW